MYTNGQQVARPPVPLLTREEQADVDRLAESVANALPGALLMLRVAEHLELTPPEIRELLQVKGEHTMMVETQESPFEQYQEGEISPIVAMRALLREERQLYAAIEHLQEQHKVLREQMIEVVDDLDEEFRHNGWFVRRMPATTIETYNKRDVENLLKELISNGQQEMADRVSACKKVSTRKGSIRIERDEQMEGKQP